MRPKCVIAAVSLLIAFLGASNAIAEDYPSRPIKWVVGYPAGGTTDILARLIGQWLSEHLGQQFIIENRPGAGNNIGTEAAINSPADGYTVLLVNPANGINASLYQKLNFNFIRDIAPVGGLTRVPNVMEVNRRRCQPRRCGSSSTTPRQTRPRSTWHRPATAPPCICQVSCSRSMTGIEMTARAVSRLGAGADRSASPARCTDVRQHAVVDRAHQGGKLRALAVTTAVRSPALPDVPTVAETVPGYEASAWFGMGAPKGHTARVIAKLNKRDQRGTRRSDDPGAPRRPGRNRDGGHAGRLRQGDW